MPADTHPQNAALPGAEKFQVHPAAGSTAGGILGQSGSLDTLLGLDTAGFFRLHPQVNQKLNRLYAPLFQLIFHRPPGGAAAPEEDDGLFSLGNNDSG